MRNISLDNSAYHKDQIRKCEKVIAEYKSRIECNKSMIKDLFENWFCHISGVKDAYYGGMLTDSELLTILSEKGEDKGNVSLNSLLLSMATALINLKDNRSGLKTLKDEKSYHRSKLVTGV